MSVLILFSSSILVDIINKHCNHCSFLFSNIKKLNQTFSKVLLKVPCIFALQNLLYMFLTNIQFIVFNNKHGSLHSSSIGVDLDFSLFDISYDGIFFWKLICSSSRPYIIQKLRWNMMITYPLTIQENFV